MFRFEKEQKVFKVGGIEVGGQPGEYPTVLIGSVFYDKHKVVKDHSKGVFDEVCVEGLIKGQEEMSDRTGNPSMLDVIGNTSEALIKYIEFIAKVSSLPFLIDSTSAEARLKAVEHVAEVGLLDRAVYNSIDYHITYDEASRLKKAGLKSAIILAYNPRNLWPEGRLEVLRGGDGGRGLLDRAYEAGVENILIDTAVLDVPSIGLAARAIYLVKSELGLPCGCAPSNATYTWRKAKKELGPHAFQVCNSCANSLPITLGANFMLYGPIEAAEAVFPACAMTDAIVAYNAKRHGVRPKVSGHPLFKIFS